jgi:hypothetical protein
MINNRLFTVKPPACHCALCVHRRAVRLTQALRNKYSPAPEFID